MSKSDIKRLIHEKEVLIYNKILKGKYEKYLSNGKNKNQEIILNSRLEEIGEGGLLLDIKCEICKVYNR